MNREIPIVQRGHWTTRAP